MTRIAPLFFLVACAPATAELHTPGAQPQPSELVCDATVEVDSEWSHTTRDYGFMRRINAFDVAGERFEQSGGVYSAEHRIYDVSNGKILLESTQNAPRAILHHPVSNTDLFYDDETLRIVDSSTGELRASVTAAGLVWFAPPVSLNGETIAMLTCDADKRTIISTFDLQGVALSSYVVDLPCRRYIARPFALHEAARRVVVGAGDHAVVIDLDTGDVLALKSHEADPLRHSEVGPMHDLWVDPNGEVVATAGADGVLMYHDMRTGDLLSSRPIRVVPVNQNIYAPLDTRSAFAWSPDGTLSARGLDDSTIVIERTCDGSVVSTLDVDPDLVPEHGIDAQAAPAALYFAADNSALMAVYEGGVQGFILRPETGSGR